MQLLMSGRCSGWGGGGGYACNKKASAAVRVCCDTGESSTNKVKPPESCVAGKLDTCALSEGVLFFDAGLSKAPKAVVPLLESWNSHPWSCNGAFSSKRNTLRAAASMTGSTCLYAASTGAAMGPAEGNPLLPVYGTKHRGSSIVTPFPFCANHVLVSSPPVTKPGSVNNWHVCSWIVSTMTDRPW